MTTTTTAAAMQELTDMQRRAVEWTDGPLLVLAGPGSGKTRVLTCRVAQLLESTPEERFRVLALTFTNKAAHEMKTRIAALAPGLEERAEINTFHGFCAQVLRQHGSHIGIKPNFEIYSRIEDREAVLEDALRRHSDQFDLGDVRLLPRIDSLKSRLISPDQAAQHMPHESAAAQRLALAHRLYEDELRKANALDFNSLILNAFELFRYPALARLYRTIYRHWLIDEFQDTNGAQYALLRLMAGDDSSRLFAVADDDQTIYEWNGANVRRIRDLVDDFGCEVIQLTDNFRCPPRIVDAANRLVVYNVQRDMAKQAAESTRPRSEGDEPKIQCRVFASDEEEARRIAEEIADLDPGKREGTGVLARSRGLLGRFESALQNLKVPIAYLGRRDDFSSPQMRWLVACLKQINRPLDHRNFLRLNETFGSFGGVLPDPDELISRSETDQVTLLAAWIAAVRDAAPPAMSPVDAVERIASGTMDWSDAVRQITALFESDEGNDDYRDDLSAWRRIEREIRDARGAVPLDQFLQEMELRSKEPAPALGSVSLGTIHGAKGLEFDTVYLIGLAEGVLPSWHSVKGGNGSAAIEEERRGCFVAITRTKKRLILSRARSYKGWSKKPSRFLAEMGLLDDSSDGSPP